MAQSEFLDRLAVCSWSLQPQTPEDLIADLRRIGLYRVQLALDPIRQGGAWSSGAGKLTEAGISVVSGMFTATGEDYSTLESIRRTGGVVPDATWPENWRNVRAIAGIARSMRLRLVTTHAGFLPEEPNHPDYRKLRERLALIADLFADHGLLLGFETGQEDAPTLIGFLRDLDRPNVGVNFDPANMILYDRGDPTDALRHLGPYLLQCHIKDANRTTLKGRWGSEAVVGTGQVDWAAFFDVLRGVGYVGDLAIERESGRRRVADILAAREFVARVLAKG